MLNRGFFPVDGDYDEFPSFRRQCEAQQARRRHAEMEYYHHMKKEEEERQRRQVATRRRQQEKEEQEYIRMKQAEMRRCRQQKAERQRKKEERRRRQQQKEEEEFMRKWQQEEVRLRKEKEQQQRSRQASLRRQQEELRCQKEAEEEYAERLRRRDEEERMRLRRQQQRAEAPQWQIVRGPDGRLYRIPVDDNESSEPEAPRSEPNRIEQYQQRQHPSIRRLNSSTAEVDDTMSMSTEHEPILEKRTKKNKSRRRKRVTILVEDASDSEMEDEELNSPFRNRQPGPGEAWLEPVGAFA